MQTKELSYAYEGLELSGFLAYDENQASRPGVLVVHDGFGLGAHIKRRAEMLAHLGYVAFALDLYGGGQTTTDALTKISALGSDKRRWRGLLTAGLETLMAQPETDRSKLAAIGYCFGGTSVYELARTGAALKGVVGFHSGLTPKTDGDAKNIKGKVLTLIGADDPLIPPEARLEFEKEMREAGVNWQMTLYGGVGHSFTNPAADGSHPGFKYDLQADTRSWAEMRRFFDEIFAAE
jgi:dienelactone hydrolase